MQTLGYRSDPALTERALPDLPYPQVTDITEWLANREAECRRAGYRHTAFVIRQAIAAINKAGDSAPTDEAEGDEGHDEVLAGELDWLAKNFRMNAEDAEDRGDTDMVVLWIHAKDVARRAAREIREQGRPTHAEEKNDE